MTASTRSIPKALLLRGLLCRAELAAIHLSFLVVTIWLGGILWMSQSTIPINSLIAPSLSYQRASGEVLLIDAQFGKRQLPDWLYLVAFADNSGKSHRALILDHKNLATVGDRIAIRYCQIWPTLATITGQPQTYMPGHLVIYGFIGFAILLWLTFLSLIIATVLGARGRLAALRTGEFIDALASAPIETLTDKAPSKPLFKRNYEYRIEGNKHQVDAYSSTSQLLAEDMTVLVNKADPRYAVPLATIMSLGKTTVDADGMFVSEPIKPDLIYALPAVLAIIANVSLPFLLLVVEPNLALAHAIRALDNPSIRTDFAKEMLSKIKQSESKGTND